jgi:hypothetical protein
MAAYGLAFGGDGRSVAGRRAALQEKRASLDIFGEEHPEGIRMRQACFCPNSGKKKYDRVYAVAFLDIVEAKYRAEKEIETLKEGLAALDAFVKGLGKAALVGDGAQGLKQKDIAAILAELTEKLPEMVPGLP